METKISILLLDDNEIHFTNLKNIITSIIKNDTDSIPEFIFTYSENAEITLCESGKGLYHYSIKGGTTEIKNKALSRLDALLQKINSHNDIIAIIDINWDTLDSTNRYGRSFWTDHLEKKGIRPINTIFTSILQKSELGRDQTLGFRFIPKNNKDKWGNIKEFTEEFAELLKEAIFATQVISEL